MHRPKPWVGTHRNTTICRKRKQKCPHLRSRNTRETSSLQEHSFRGGTSGNSFHVRKLGSTSLYRSFRDRADTYNMFFNQTKGPRYLPVYPHCLAYFLRKMDNILLRRSFARPFLPALTGRPSPSGILQVT